MSDNVPCFPGIIMPDYDFDEDPQGLFEWIDKIAQEQVTLINEWE